MKFVTDIFAKAGLIVDGSVTLNTTPNANIDTDKFLVQDGAIVKYRTGAEVLSDIGAQGALTLTVIGNSGPSTLISNTLNVPTYTLAGLGGVPLTRTLTINGVGYDLSADRSWSVGTVTSVDMSVPTGFAISGNPITSSGTLALAFAAGYALPTVSSQLNWNSAYNNMVTAISYNTSTGDLTLTQQDLGTLSTTITLQPFTTTNLVEGTNLYYTDTRVRNAISLTTTGTTGASTYTALTGVFNIPVYQGQLTLTTTGSSGSSTLVGDTLNIPTYTLSGLGGVPSTRQLTINGTAYDLSADRSWSVGTVTSVDMSVPTGFTISGNPITTTGTLALAFASGYALPTVASQLNWNSAYNNMITAISYNTGTGEIVLTQQDLGTLSAFVTLQPFSTTNLVEGTNLYYTDARARLALSAGVGISYDNTTGVITNSAPDQTVVLTGAGTTVITGTYPNFTITSNDQYVGTVTSVAALTIGTTGTDLSSTVANSTTTPVITLNVPTASAINRGALSSTDWSTFNAKQNAITLTTTGSSGSATFVADVLNIPTYTLSGLGGVPSTRTINGLALSSDQTFATGTTGTDFNIVSAGTVHTFNIPDASATARGLINATTQTIAGTKTFTSSPIVPSLYLANMGLGSGAVYYNVSENRLTLANYNVGGEIKFEVNGGVYTMTLNSDLTIELMGYTTDGFLKTSGGNGLLVVDTTTYTPTSRTLTINGTSYDLSANRTWSVGTVTSVGLSVPTGFSVASTPVTTSGTIALSFASGYSLPTNSSQTNWDTAYNSRISSLTTTGTSGAATLVANVLNIPQYQAQGNYITSLTGEATASGPGAASVTLSNSAVIGKVLTGLTVTSGSIVSTDSILSAFGKIQGQINALAGGLQYQGVWNANTNTPTITSGVGTDGYFYIVNVAGNTTIDGNTGWQVGDWIVFDGTVWQKVDNTDAVTSVNGFTGAVVLTTTNISEGTNLYYTDARARQAISLTTTGSSGAATYSNVTGVLNIPQYTLAGLGGVPTTRTLTINGTAYDLSADRSWSVGTVTSIATSGPITGGTITGSGTIGITQATSTTSGYLSSTDWNTFNSKQNAITLTVTGSSGPATLVGATLNIPEYTLSGLGGVPSTRTLTINGTSYDLSANRTWSVGTVTSITFSGPLTGGTITGSGTVGITQASGSSSGYLSSTDWTTFNNKQNAITLTTTGSSGAATFVGATLNIPNYTLSGLGGVPTSRTLTINGTAYDLSADRSWSVGTVTSVAATAGTGISVSGSPITGSGTLTITNTGVTSLTAGTGISVSASTGGITITNTAPAPTNTVTGTGTTNYVARWTSSSVIGTGVLYDNGTNVGISSTAPVTKLDVIGQSSDATTYGILTLRNSSSGGISLGASGSTYTWIQGNVYGSGIANVILQANGGNVGINNTSPVAKLDVVKSDTWSSGNLLGINSNNTSTYTSGASTGLVSINAIGASQFSVFTGSATLGNTGRHGGFESLLNIGNTSAGTVTLTQATNIRAMAAITAATYYYPAAATTITHLAGIRILPDINTGAATMTITNKYGLLIGDASGGTGSITYTNRWGIYQEGALDINYFASSVLIGTTTNAGYKLDVNGTGIVRGALTISGPSPLKFKYSDNYDYYGIGYITGADYGFYNYNYGRIDLLFTQSTGAATFSSGIATNGYTASTSYAALFNGSVGINTTSPTKSLHVYTTANEGMYLQGSGAGVWFDIKSSTSNIYSIGAQTGGMGVYDRTTIGYKFFIRDTGQLQFNLYTSSSSFTGTAAGYLAFDSSGNIITTANGGVGGSGTTNYVARWTGTNTLGTGVLYDNGTNVGIGTTSPTKQLSIYDASSARLNFTTSTTGQTITDGTEVGVFATNNNAFIWNYENSDFYIGTNNTERMRITSGGNVGINTTTPSRTLVVNGETWINLTSDYFGAGTTVQISANGSGAVGVQSNTLYLYPYSGNTASSLIYGYNGGASWRLANTGGSSRFDIYSYGGSLTVGSFFSSGNTSFGSTSDTGLAKLQVTGAIQQTSVTSSMLKTNSSGVLVAAVAGTDYLTSTSSDFSYNASLTLSTSWQDSGVNSNNLTTSGVYIVTCFANDYNVSGGQYSETYAGIMYWRAGGTNSDDYSEISLHHSGHHDGGRFIYLRTKTTYNADGKTYLQIKGNGNNSGASTYTFTFKRLM